MRTNFAAVMTVMALLGLATIGDAGAQQPVIGGAVIAQDPATTFDVSDLADRAKLFFEFDGERMTDARAIALADAEDFDFVSWEICPNTANCMVVEVKGRKAGWIYRYIVLGERCSLVATRNDRPLDQLGPVLGQPRATLEAARMLPGQPIVDRQPVGDTIRHPTVQLPDAGGRSADSCFGGYKVVIRSRQHNSYISDNLGYSARFEQIYQAVVADKWTPFMTTVIGAWQTPVPNTGMTETGKSYSWTDGSGTVLQEDADVFQWIASTGASTGVTAQQLCDAKFKQKTAALNTAAEAAAGGLCAIIPLPTAITVGGSGTLAGTPAGVGGTITLNGSATKTFDYCATNRNIALSLAALAAANEYTDCLENPGRYFPAQFPPVEESLDLAGLEGFESRNPEEIKIVGSCPITKQEQISQEMGGGMTCTSTTNYVCSAENDACTCKQSGMQEIVCVSGG